MPPYGGVLRLHMEGNYASIWRGTTPPCGGVLGFHIEGFYASIWRGTMPPYRGVLGGIGEVHQRSLYIEGWERRGYV